MVNKNVDLLKTGIGIDLPMGVLNLASLKKRKKPQKTSAFVSVRSSEKIPSALLAYFKFHPKQKRALTDEEKQLHAQVYLHELEEGARLLSQHQHQKQASLLIDFQNAMHPEQRLELMRQLLGHPSLQQRSPEFSQSYKIRHNQWGAVQGRLDHHHYIAYTNPGFSKKNLNEDGFLILHQEKIIAVADGVSTASGGIASCIAIDFFEAAILQGKSITEAVAYANEAILLRQRSERGPNALRPIGSTFSAVQIQKEKLHVAHMGDTKVLVLRKGQIIWESLDHTQGQELYRAGLVDEETALALNHILNRYLGYDVVQWERDVEYSEIPLLPGDYIFLMSDGLTDNFFEAGFNLPIISHLAASGSLEEIMQRILLNCQSRLKQSKLPNGRPPKPDNISLALIHYQG